MASYKTRILILQTAKTNIVLPQRGYLCCRQSEEMVVMRGLLLD